jgi:hypothetical protein
MRASITVVSRTTLILVLLLVATNAAWLMAPAPEGGSHEVVARPEGRAGSGVAAMSDGPWRGRLPEPVEAGARLAGTPPIGAPPRGSALPESAHEQHVATVSNEQRVAVERRAWEQVTAWRADVLQPRDPGRRQAGLDAMAGAIRSGDEAVTLATLQSLVELRNAEYDAEGLRDAVRRRLDDPETRIRHAAAAALRHVKPDASDVDTLLRLLAARPTDTQLLGAALGISPRAEGPLADAWLAALAAAPPREHLQLARYLTGTWVSEAVEAAVVGAFQRIAPGEREAEWYELLGSLRPTREPRVRLVFEEERRGTPRGVPSIARARLHEALGALALDPSATRLAVTLALELLDAPSDSTAGDFCLDVLRAHGTAVDAPALRVHAANPMVAPLTRRKAADLAEALERRR